MEPPVWAMTSRATVLTKTSGHYAGLGQAQWSWTPTGTPIPAAHYPAGTRVQRQAQLRGVVVQREVYLAGSVELNPETNRLQIDGSEYEVTLVNVWNGITVCGVTRRITS